ncbi:MAG: PD-(D/E)XK nuclease family protein [Candidatus Sericytochromatia bacterium]|nr:PD-(D/E)XK nuclease family protein [Candidatus Sericytochromatia bacterium]
MNATRLPPLSYSNLTTFAACQKQYELRYLSALGWPLIPAGDAVASEEAEHLGNLFHLAVEQRANDQDVSLLLNESPKLHAWWLAFLRNRFDRPQGHVWHEARLGLPFGDERILVVMDRLQNIDGQWTVWDWKTGRQFQREALGKSWQTRLYRFALAQAGQIFNAGEPIPPAAITMAYWSAEHDRIERFPYDAEAYAADGQAILLAIGKLHVARTAGFPMTGLGTACDAKGRPCSFVPLCLGTTGANDLMAETWEPDGDPVREPDDDPFV